jgi:hypothetical protein
MLEDSEEHLLMMRGPKDYKRKEHRLGPRQANRAAGGARFNYSGSV